jgi:hypothetical protein
LPARALLEMRARRAQKGIRSDVIFCRMERPKKQLIYLERIYFVDGGGGGANSE